MKDTLISFETAKLAKEKGFDWECINYYQDSKRAGSFKIDTINNKLIDELHEDDKYCVIYYSAASQSVLQRWLREVHQIDLFMDIWGFEGEFYHIEDITKGFGSDRLIIGNGGAGSANYEEALEMGLMEALKLI